MKIFITGGSGFVGTHLIKRLLTAGHDVTSVGRRKSYDALRHEHLAYISADTRKAGEWQDEVQKADVIINLAGKSLFGIWTDSHKKAMYDSRILTTRHIVDTLPEGSDALLVSASAAGYYGDQGDEKLDEDALNGGGFLAEISWDWEAEAKKAFKKGARVVMTRFGIVLGRNGGALEKMLPAYRMFLGGSLGDGKQWFPWIHIQDLVDAVFFAIENSELKGPVNFCAPNPVRFRTLAKTLGRVLNRPAVMPAPAFIVRMLLGEFGDSLLVSTRMIPRKLLNAGFEFTYPQLEAALKDLV